jgi:predicted CXXCH cytochrome family protein
VKCTDCHNPHGGFLTRQLRASASQDTVCYKCYSDKAGPFVYEHESVKGCVVCHTPARVFQPADVTARAGERGRLRSLCSSVLAGFFWDLE